MANVMNMKQVKNNVSRDGFDLSKKVNFTAKAGELLPVYCKEVIPGDKVTIDLSSFTRTMPVNTAAFARIREYYDFFFVPFSHLWNRANTVLSQMNFNQQHAVSLISPPTGEYVGAMPFITASQIANYIRNVNGLTPATQYKTNLFGFNRAALSCKLLQYLGYGDYSPFLENPTGGFNYNPQMNVFGLLAYQKIYSDFYRDQQWEYPAPSTFNVDYLSGTGANENAMQVPIPTESTHSFYQNYTLFDLRYVNWNKDLYHGILPNAQYGETAVVPINGDGFDVSKLSINSVISSSGEVVRFNSNGMGTINQPTDATLMTGRSWTASSGSKLMAKNDTGMTDLIFGSPTGLQVTSNASYSGASTPAGPVNGGLSILALRQYQFLQKWKEIVQSTQQNYKDQVKAIWNVDVSDHLSETVTYLGGINSSLSINEVLNTNLTGENAQAEIFGKGVGSARGKIEFDSRGEFGYIMCIYHCQPVVDYTVGYIEPQFLRVNAEDFANPVFDKVGMQQITDVSLLTRFSTAYNFESTPRVLGYVPRYADYKTDIDQSLGGFRESMSHWVVSYDADDVYSGLTGGMVSQVGPTGQPNPNGTDDNPNLDISSTYTFMKINPHLLDPIFATEANDSVDTDQFLCSAFFDVKMVRNLDADGLPY